MFNNIIKENFLKKNNQKMKGIKEFYDNFIQYQINLNLEIEKKIFQNVQFKDKYIEEKFQQNQTENERIQKIFSDIVIFLGYIASLIYIFFAYFRIEIFCVCIICKIFSIISTVISYKTTKNKFFYYLSEHLNIFFLVLSLTLKCFIINFCYNTDTNDNESENLRIIIYHFVSTNLFLILKFEANIFNFIFYFNTSIIMIIISTLKSNKNHFYFLEALTSFLFSFIFWGFRKVYDYLLRVNFAEKYKFENFYKYTFDFINGLNIFHVNFKNDIINYIDHKFEDILLSLDRDFKILEKSALESLIVNENQIIKSLEIEKFINNTVSYLYTIHGKNMNSLSEFIKNLIPFKDIYDVENKKGNLLKVKSDKNLLNDIFQKINQQEKENIFKNQTFDKYLNEKNVTLYSILQILKNYEKYITSEENSDINNFIKLGIFHFKNNETKKYFEVYFRYCNLYKNDKISMLDKNDNFLYDLLFYDISELILSKKIIFEENIIKQKILAKIAHEFKTPINSIIGLIETIKENYLEDSSKNIEKKNSLENKRVCYNNGLIDITTKNEYSDLNIQKNDNDLKKVKTLNKNKKILNIIENLSKYVIFLISDIIQYSNMKENQLILSIENINIEEIANFVFEILKCLLKCNNSKKNNIKPELIFDKLLKGRIIKTDELRIKQILLNIISNSVKFTKHGKIMLIFELNQETNEIIIIIDDTGIGIKDEDKKKLFNDFVMLENGLNQNAQGSGLGLSICKNLAFKLNFKLNFESNYGKGSKFFVHLPIEGSGELLDNDTIKSLNMNINLFKYELKDSIGEFFDIKKARTFIKNKSKGKSSEKLVNIK